MNPESVVPGGDGHLGSQFAELVRHSLSETGAAAGDEDDSVLERVWREHGAGLGREEGRLRQGLLRSRHRRRESALKRL